MKKSGLPFFVNCESSICLKLLLIGCLLIPSLAWTDTTSPSAPESLQSVRYSSTAGEIYWSSAIDASTIIGYRVIRNGQSIGVRDARSVFEGQLEPDVSYQYSVSAIDQFGNEGPSIAIELSAVIGQREISHPLDTDTDTDTDT